ncbi:MAG: hypothetical protein ACRCXA_04075 [Peptostreptococcaceae bacterium]
MKKFFKGLMTLLCISAAISLGLLVFWIIGVAFVVTYLFKAKDKYDNINDFLKEKRNIIALLCSVILIVVIPVAYTKNLKEYNEKSKELSKQQAILDAQKEKELEEKNNKNERNKVLNAKSKLKKDLKDGKDITKAGLLKDEEIEKYDITEDEIEKYENDRENAIIENEEKELARIYDSMAKEYVSEVISSTVSRFKYTDSGYNDDMTKFIVKGYYTGTNQYGASVRANYEVEFDLETGQITNSVLGKERVSSKNN